MTFLGTSHVIKANQHNFNADIEFNSHLNNFYQSSNINQLENYSTRYEQKYNSLSNNDQIIFENKFTNMPENEAIRAINHFIKISGVDVNPVKRLADIPLFGHIGAYINYTNINDLMTLVRLIDPKQFSNLQISGLKQGNNKENIAYNKEMIGKVKKYITTKSPKQIDQNLENIIKSAVEGFDKKNSTQINKVLNKLIINGVDLSDIAESAFDDDIIKNNKEHHNAVLLIASLQSVENNKKRTAVVTDRLKAASQKTDNSQIYDAVHSNISNRVENRTSYNNENGIAAGENPMNIGLWVKGLYGISNQKAINQVDDGYSARNFGGSIGIDFSIDNSILGLAYSNISSNIKFKQSRAGDKLDINSHVGSIYAQVAVNDVFMWNPIVSYNYSDYKAKDIVNLNNSNKIFIAKGKYKGEGTIVDNSFHYRIDVAQSAAIVPNLGLKYNVQYEKDHRKNGVGIYNTKTSKYSRRAFIGSIGAKAFISQQVSDDILIQPAVYFAAEKYFSKKASNLDVGLTWTNEFDTVVSSKNKKSDEIGYNIGTSILAKNGNIELSAAYNCNLRKKYSSHQGSLKFKLSI